MTISAKVVLASYNDMTGKTLYTVQCRYPRFIHAEVLTHRMFSRNSASSRAVPIEKMIDRVKDDPATPIHWGKNQKGMQAYTELTGDDKYHAEAVWERAKDYAIYQATKLAELGVHKQIANRLLEPFSHIEVVITATEWDNFFRLRDHHAAQPEIQKLAQEIKQAMLFCQIHKLPEGAWHTPFILDDEKATYSQAELVQISIARCARVSYYLPEDPNQLSSPDRDLELYMRLKTEGHLSPFEHIATPCRSPVFYDNLFSFKSYRYLQNLFDPTCSE